MLKFSKCIANSIPEGPCKDFFTCCIIMSSQLLGSFNELLKMELVICRNCWKT